MNPYPDGSTPNAIWALLNAWGGKTSSNLIARELGLHELFVQGALSVMVTMGNVIRHPDDFWSVR